MKRREFISLVGGAAVAWPLAARAQQAAMTVVGYLSGRSAETDVPMLAALRNGLAERGYVEGRNLRIEYRFADGQYARLPALAVDLVERKVAAMVTGGGLVPAESAKAATMTIPVVFNIADDPVRFGLVESLSRPGRNLTGVTSFQTVVMEKQVGLLSELLPGPTTIALLGDPQMREVEFQLENARTAAIALGHRSIIVRANDDSSLDAAFTDIRQKDAGALLVAASPFFMTRLKRLVEHTARLALPAIYWRREVVEAGGLMMYGSNTFEMYHQAGVYIGRILKGENPGELPVWQPTKFEFILNLKTAKALRLKIPDKILALADEVIE
jgi:putative tryptophan/tyrosine transport system substrate-binding protein